MDANIDISALVIVMLLAFAVPPLLSRLKVIRIPTAVGEVVAGMIIGQSGLQLLRPDISLEVLQFLGLLYLMFAAGLEVDFNALSGKQPGLTNNGGIAKDGGLLARLHHPLTVGVAFTVITVLVSYGWVVNFTDRALIPYPLAFALLMGTVGFSIIMPVLKETEKLATPFGQLVVGIAAIGDFAPVLGMTVLVTMHKQGSLVDVLLLVALLIAAVLFYRVARRFQSVKMSGQLTEGTAQIDVRGATLLMLAFGLLAQVLRVDIILGAFLAGLIISALMKVGRKDLIHKMDAVGFGFLIPVFFIMVGVKFDIGVLLANPAALAFIPVLLIALIVIKAGVAMMLRLWYPLRLTLAGAALLTAQMSVTVAFASVLMRAGMIDEAIHAAVVLTAILTAILGPVVYTRLLPPKPAEEIPRSGVILVGAGRESFLIARSLADTGEAFVIIDTDEEKIAAAEEAGIEAMQADATEAETLAAVGADTFRVIVGLTGSDEVNVAACRLAIDEFGVKRAVAVVRNPANMEEAHWSGLEMINPGLAVSALVEMMVTSPSTAALVAGQTDGQRLRDIVLRNRRYAGLQLRKADLPPRLLIVSVGRGDERITPHGDTVLQVGDVLTMAGTSHDLHLARELLGRSGRHRR